jgi:hypothetical protein
LLISYIAQAVDITIDNPVAHAMSRYPVPTVVDETDFDRHSRLVRQGGTLGKPLATVGESEQFNPGLEKPMEKAHEGHNTSSSGVSSDPRDTDRKSLRGILKTRTSGVTNGVDCEPQSSSSNQGSVKGVTFSLNTGAAGVSYVVTMEKEHPAVGDHGANEVSTPIKSHIPQCLTVRSTVRAGKQKRDEDTGGIGTSVQSELESEGWPPKDFHKGSDSSDQPQDQDDRNESETLPLSHDGSVTDAFVPSRLGNVVWT